MDKLHQIVNANKNDPLRAVCYNKDIDPFTGVANEELIYLAPEAAKIIQKHGTQFWKNFPDHSSYSWAEFVIAQTINDNNDRDYKIQLIAIVIECSPLSLYNDPELPF